MVRKSARKSNVIRPGFAGHVDEEHPGEEQRTVHVVQAQPESTWDKIKWTVITGGLGAVAGGVALYMLNKHVLGGKKKDKKKNAESNMADARQNLLNSLGAQANPYQNPMMAAAYPTLVAPQPMMQQPMYGQNPYMMQQPAFAPMQSMAPMQPMGGWQPPQQPQIFMLPEASHQNSGHDDDEYEDDDDDDEYEYDEE